MLSKLEILSQVLLSLKNDQNDAMNNINAILNTRDTREGLVDSLKSEINRLANVHASMQETQSFIIQMSQETLKKESGENNNEETQEK